MTVYETINLMLLFGTLMVSTIFGILSLTVELIKMYIKEDTKNSETARKTNTKK